MARAPNKQAEQAEKMFRKGIPMVDIAKKLGVSAGTVRSWKNRYKWDNATLQNDNNATLQRKRGGQPNNKNAVGNDGGAPLGNKNAVKHGVFETIYDKYLPECEQEILQDIPSADNLDNEIRLLRLKMIRLLQRDAITTYDVFGNAHERALTEDERENGIRLCTAEIRKLVKTKKEIEFAQAKLQNADEDKEKEIASMLRGLVDDLNN